MDSPGPTRPARRTGPRRLLAALLGLALGAAAALPAPARAEPPMWVLRDPDSTVYLFGTAHLLDPSIPWQTERVRKALDEATELWVEIAIPPGGEMQMAMSMLQRALSPDKPLSSQLTEAEQQRLRKLLGKVPQGQALALVVESARPWFVTMLLGTTPLMAAGYDSEAGADMVLMRMAREQGDVVRGLETAEQQIEMLASAPEEQQLAELKALLAVPEEEFDASIREMDEAVRAWMKGDTKPLEEVSEKWRSGEDEALAAATSYTLMIVRRNEDWAEQIAKLMAGSGVAFVAVGAGHLVGPDSLQEKLRARGIRATRY